MVLICVLVRDRLCRRLVFLFLFGLCVCVEGCVLLSRCCVCVVLVLGVRVL